MCGVCVCLPVCAGCTPQPTPWVGIQLTRFFLSFSGVPGSHQAREQVAFTLTPRIPGLEPGGGAGNWNMRAKRKDTREDFCVVTNTLSPKQRARLRFYQGDPGTGLPPSMTPFLKCLGRLEDSSLFPPAGIHAAPAAAEVAGVGAAAAEQTNPPSMETVPCLLLPSYSLSLVHSVQPQQNTR